MTTFRDGYGKLAFGALLYGIDAAQVDGASVAVCASTVSVSGQIIKDAAASASCASTVTAAGGYDAKGSASISATSSVALYWNRLRPFEAQVATTAESTRVSARYKWLDATDPTTAWTKADYLERAA
jgi:hypothetical protein